MGKLEVYPKEDPKNSKVLISITDRKEYDPIYVAFRSYLSGMTMERLDSSIKIC
jgi:hypothetical protein